MEKTRIKIVMEEKAPLSQDKKNKYIKEITGNDTLFTRRYYDNDKFDIIKNLTNSNDDKLSIREIYKILDEIEKHPGEPRIDKPFISKFICNDKYPIEKIKEYIKKNI